MLKKVLIVEDNPQNRKLVVMTLRSESYELLEATDGEQALKLAQAQTPDIILMDVQLPKINGLEVTRRLRALPEFKHTPIIAITAFAMQGDIKNIMEAGCSAHITKPFSTRDLRRLIAGVLEIPDEGGKLG
jgi:two-component system, cell cycle response regulator DivK